jgi:hypothetical protein
MSLNVACKRTVAWMTFPTHGGSDEMAKGANTEAVDHVKIKVAIRDNLFSNFETAI